MPVRGSALASRLPAWYVNPPLTPSRAGFGAAADEHPGRLRAASAGTVAPHLFAPRKASSCQPVTEISESSLRWL